MTTITGPVLKPDNVTIWTGLLITFHARPGDYGASSVLPAPLVKTRTDSSGAFSVDLPAGEYVVSYPEYSESYFEAQTAPETRFSITVPSSGPVSLQVLRNQTLQQAGGYVTRSALAADVAAAVDQTRHMQPMASVMASPPTITPGTAGAASTISGAVDVLWTDSRLRYLGATPTVVTVNSVDFGRVETWASGAPSQSIWSVEFDVYAKDFDLIISATSADKYRMWVDGQLVADAPTSQATTGYRVRHKVSFAAAAFRSIRVDLGSNLYFNGVAIGPTDSLFRPTSLRGKQYVATGDSFAAGSAGVTDAFHGIVETIRQLRGWRSMRYGAQGGTGYLNPGTGSKRKYRDRVADDIPADADMVLVIGSTNDLAYNPGSGVVTAAQIATEAGLYYDAIKARAPQAKLVVLLPFQLVGSPQAALLAANQAVKAVALTKADLVIDPIAEGWFSGSGQVGSTTGSGNADIFRASDGTHPTDAGATYVARRVAEAIARAFPSL